MATIRTVTGDIDALIWECVTHTNICSSPAACFPAGTRIFCWTIRQCGRGSAAFTALGGASAST